MPAKVSTLRRPWRGDVDRQLALRKDGFRNRLEFDIPVVQTSAGSCSRRYGQIRIDGHVEREPQGGRGSDGSVEPVADEPAKLNDVLALAGRRQKGLPSLGVQ